MALLDSPTGWEEQVLSIHLNCPQCGTSLPAIDPRTFSFNSPHGACPACEGLGSRTVFLADLVVPDRAVLVGISAAPPWSLLISDGEISEADQARVREFFVRHGISSEAAVLSWPGRVWDGFWSGEPDRGFPGLAALLERLLRERLERSLAQSSGRVSGRGTLCGLRRVATELSRPCGAA